MSHPINILILQELTCLLIVKKELTNDGINVLDPV